MKFTLKLLLIVVLFCGTAMADGDMGGGGGLAPTTGTPEARTTKVSDAMLVYVSKLVISFLR